MAPYKAETDAGHAERIRGRIEKVIDDAAETAGQKNTQFRGWGKLETSIQERMGEGGPLGKKKNETGDR